MNHVVCLKFRELPGKKKNTSSRLATQPRVPGFQSRRALTYCHPPKEDQREKTTSARSPSLEKDGLQWLTSFNQWRAQRFLCKLTDEQDTWHLKKPMESHCFLSFSHFSFADFKRFYSLVPKRVASRKARTGSLPSLLLGAFGKNLSANALPKAEGRGSPRRRPHGSRAVSTRIRKSVGSRWNRQI